MKTQHLLFCLFGVMVLTEIAYAEVDFGKKTPSADQVIEALDPSKANPDLKTDDTDYEGDTKTGKTRSINMERLDATPKTKTKPKAKTPMKPTETALSMEIMFGYNSAELTEAAKEQLNPVGKALASEKLHSLDFVVEGHTDAIGGQLYNKTLSEERAASVKRFLVDTFQIQPSRIAIIGKGKSDLLDPKNPDSEVNRRVRIVARK
jgi:outer membrane protein OmpA-like peptidoglycan-associated protein